jgi:hypothetical protein
MKKQADHAVLMHLEMAIGFLPHGEARDLVQAAHAKVQQARMAWGATQTLIRQLNPKRLPTPAAQRPNGPPRGLPSLAARAQVLSALDHLLQQRMWWAYESKR